MGKYDVISNLSTLDEGILEGGYEAIHQRLEPID
jgi:hypothetical protein